MDEFDEAKAKDVEEHADRLLTEWSLDKIRVYNVKYGLWWRWNKSGYTNDITEAGLYDKSWKPHREEDRVYPVDPTKFVFDALMAKLKAQ